MKPDGIYQFGEFRIEALARTVRREKEIVTLNRRAFDVLLYFVLNPGRVLTRDELLKNVWQDTFVDENTLAQSISALRRALEERPGDNSYIVTLPGRGYQFVSPVRVIAPENMAMLPDAAMVAGGVVFQQQTIRTSVVTEEKQQLSLPTPRPPTGIRLLAALTIAVIAVAGIYGWKQLYQTPPSANPSALRPTGSSSAPRRSIAVLGFRNLSGTRIRLDLRLQDTVAGETITDVAVVGGQADLFDMVSQAGSRLRERLGVEAVSPVEAVSVRASLPSNRDAARLYSEGLARLRVFDALEARDLLQRAIAADPKYSLAHSALAEAWSRLGYDKKAQEEARKAFELAANLSREERFVVEGRYHEFDHQYEKAIEVYRALFTLFPDNVDYGLKLATAQVRGHKGDDALATVESLRKLPLPASGDPRIELTESDGWRVLGDFKHQEAPLARAVEKAKAQGARLILARALEDQAMLFNFLGRAQDAIALCRESRDISAAAGNRQGEARALRASADILSNSGDLPGAIRLYQQAQSTFQKIGSEGGVASVLNNLGNIFEREGDLATAEKMYRQAQDSFRLLDDDARRAVVTGNVAEGRMEQGDLRGALQLHQEQLQLGDAANTENAALADYGIAAVRRLQGDLAGARHGFEHSLAAWQAKGNRNASAYAMWSLGGLLLEEADFLGGRKMYEQALAIRTTAGDTLATAESQLGLADLSL